MTGSTQYRFESLRDDHDRSTFICESAPLTRFFHERALRDMRHRLSATHVLVESDSESIVGYYTLAAASIAFEEIPEALRRKAKLSRYPQLSSVLLARLARHQDWRGNGLGSFLVADALKRSWRSTAHIGAAFVLVDAIDQRAFDFYKGFGFIPLGDAINRLFLPMTTVAELFAG